MARTWLRIQVDLLGGPGIDCDPTPGRVFIVGPAHTFEQFAHAINVAFARWDLSHIHQFELTDGRLIGYPDDTHAPDLVWLDHAKLKVAREVKPEDEFEFVFDLGDNWQHRCTVPEPRSTRSRNTELFRPARSRSSDGDGSRPIRPRFRTRQPRHRLSSAPGGISLRSPTARSAKTRRLSDPQVA